MATLKAAGLNVRAVVLPDGKDPDEFVSAEGKDAFQALVDAAPDFVSFYVKSNEERARTVEGRTAVAKEIFTILRAIDDLVRRDEYLKRTARELGLQEHIVRSEFARTAKVDSSSKLPKEAVEAEKKAFSKDDAEFISVLLNSEPLFDQVRDALGGYTLRPGPVEHLLGVLLDAQDTHAPQLPDDPDVRRLYALASNQAPVEPEKAEALANKRVASLLKETLKAQAQRVQGAIEDAQRRKDLKEATRLLAEKMSISQQIEQIGAA